MSKNKNIIKKNIDFEIFLARDKNTGELFLQDLQHAHTKYGKPNYEMVYDAYSCSISRRIRISWEERGERKILKRKEVKIKYENRNKTKRCE